MRKWFFAVCPYSGPNLYFNVYHRLDTQSAANPDYFISPALLIPAHALIKHATNACISKFCRINTSCLFSDSIGGQNEISCDLNFDECSGSASSGRIGYPGHNYQQ